LTALAGIAVDVISLFMALLSSRGISTPRAYKLKASNAAPHRDMPRFVRLPPFPLKKTPAGGASPEWRKPWASLATQYLLNKVVRDHDGKDEEAKVLQKTVMGQYA
jgi:hypothetical protein